MASSSGLLDRISCSLCMEQFDSNKHAPKLLPCQHTFCSDCLSSLRTHSLDFTLDETIQCPVCRRKITVPNDGFTTNWTVLDIAEEIQHSAANVSTCTKHDRECVLVCIDCLVVLCVICLKKSSHHEHNLEEPHKAEALLHQKLSMLVKERASSLEKKIKSAKDASCTVAGITDAEKTIELLRINLEKVLRSWADEQMSFLGKLKNSICKFRK